MTAIRNYLAQHGRMLAVCLLVGALLGFVGAFGSDQAPLVNRFGFWMTMMPLGGLIGSLMTNVVSRFRYFDGRPYLYATVLSLAVALPMTGLVYAGLKIAFPTFGQVPGLFLFVVVAVLSFVMTNISLQIERGNDAAVPNAKLATTSSDPFARLRERLPAKIRAGALWALEAEDHYVRVHTSIGTDLVLMRLSDAIELLDTADGLRIHRSWWVAKAGVKGIVRDEGRVSVGLKSGVLAPVARARVSDVRDAGWGR